MIYIDCSDVSRLPGIQTGIQRVTRSLLAEMMALSDQVVPAIMGQDGLFYRLNAIPQVGDSPHAHKGELLFFKPGDTYLVMDSNWVGEPLRRLNSFKPYGLTIGVVFYDLIPLTHPELCGVEQSVFQDWVKETAAYADYFACISESTKADLKRELKAVTPEWKWDDSTCFSFNLGADVPSPPDDSIAVRSEMQEFFEGEKPYLAISTVEIRKNHALLLDAFESLWNRFPDLKLCFIGREGWMVDDLLRRLAAHPMNKKQFRWFKDCSDKEVVWAYRQAKCTLQPSFAEGYGLPIIESLHAGTPALVSDIPVFWEIAGDHVGYFDPHSPASLERWIERIETENALEQLKPACTFCMPVWKESATELLEKIGVADHVARQRLEPALCEYRMKQRMQIEGQRATASGGTSVRTPFRHLIRLHGDELIRMAYLRFLHRLPDPEGESLCRHLLASGLSPVQLVVMLRYSPEGLRVAEPLKCARLIRLCAKCLGSKNMLGKGLRYVTSLGSLAGTRSIANAAFVHQEALKAHVADLQAQNQAMRHELKTATDQSKIIQETLARQTAAITELKAKWQAFQATPELPFSVAVPVEPYLQRAEKQIGKKAPIFYDEKTEQFYTYFSEIWDNKAGIQKIYESYLPYLKFKSDELVLDIGCGSGEFLGFLKKNNVNAKGIDLNPVEVERARQLGLNAECAEAMEFLRHCDEKFNAISLIEVIEHVPQEQHMELLMLAREKLTHQGILLIETINPLHSAGVNGFYTDPTHTRPVTVDYLTFLIQWCGFKHAELLYSSPYPIYTGLAKTITGLNYTSYALIASLDKKI